MSTPAPSSPSAGRRRSALIVAGAIVLALAVGAVVWWQARPADAVALEPAAGLGLDPFLDAVASAPAAEFTEVVKARVIETTSALTADADTGGRSAPGDTAGLYGGSTSDSVCDVAALAQFLAENEAPAAAWAQVRGIEVADIADHLRGLVAVYLTADTLVINHGFDGTRATPRNAVLQAGTAVLVDSRGLPAVRCACGNPLLPLGGLDLGGASASGTAWDGFDAAGVVTVSAAPEPLTTLTVIDTATADLVPLDIRSVVGAVLVATSVDGLPETAQAGAVHVSTNGTTWEKVLDAEPLYGVDTAPGLAVAVGVGGRGGGTIHTSTDGTTWSAPIEVIDPLVAVAHGDGTWIAVGNRSFAEEGGAGDASSGAIYRSADAVAWERVATTDPYENSELAAGGGFVWQTMWSVGYGAGLWVATATECNSRVCQLVQFTSADGRAWTRHGLDGGLVRMDVDHDGEQWGFVGGEDSSGGQNQPQGLAGTSADGITWSTGATEPGRVVLTGLDAGPDGWYAVDVPTYDSQAGTPSAGGVYRSTDLRSWEQVGTVTPGITGIAVLTGGRPSGPTTPTPTPAGTPTSAGELSAVTEVRILTRGLMLMAGDDPPVLLYEDAAAPAVEALTAVFGEPATTQVEGDGFCSADSTRVAWGGFSISFEGADPSVSWHVRLEGTSGDLPRVPVGTAGGITLGSTADDVANYFPGVPHESYRHEGVTYDLFYLDSSEDGERGTEVMATDGVVSVISAPVYLQGDC